MSDFMWFFSIVLILYFVLVLCDIGLFLFFFCKQKTAYEMRISDWSSDVCSSDLRRVRRIDDHAVVVDCEREDPGLAAVTVHAAQLAAAPEDDVEAVGGPRHVRIDAGDRPGLLYIPLTRVVDFLFGARSEEHPSELQSLMPISYAVFCLKKN